MLVKEGDREWLARLGFSLNQSVRDIYLGNDEEVTESTNDGGIELIFDYKSKYFDGKVDYVGELRFYQPVFYSGKSDFEDLDPVTDIEAARLDADVADYTTTMDVDFKNTFITNITSALNVQFAVWWVYDKYDTSVPAVIDEAGNLQNADDVLRAVRKSGQFKQTLSIGLAHTF